MVAGSGTEIGLLPFAFAFSFAFALPCCEPARFAEFPLLCAAASPAGSSAATTNITSAKSLDLISPLWDARPVQGHPNWMRFYQTVMATLDVLCLDHKALPDWKTFTEAPTCEES